MDAPAGATKIPIYQVIIAGFGRSCSVIGRQLTARGVRMTGAG